MKGFLIAFLPCVILAHFSLTWPPSRHYGSQESAGITIGGDIKTLGEHCSKTNKGR